jgi:CheY-like chemotaxis protein
MKILFIEDDICTQVAVSEYLKFLYKMDIVKARHGQEGLDKLATGEHFDCIILDERMPVMSGEEFLQAYEGSVPIVYSTAFSDRDPVRPVAAIIPKPYEARKLGEAVMRICGKNEE